LKVVLPAIGVRVGSHASGAVGRQFLQFRMQASSLVEQRLGLVTAHPLFEQREMIGIAARVGDRDLVGAPKAFDPQTIDFLRAGPSLGCAFR
jgi:hypothetical protein